MNATELELAKNTFVQNTDWVAFFARLLLFGVVAEVFTEIVFRKDKSWVEIIAGVTFATAVAIGVWGEIHFGEIASEAAGKIQAGAEQEIARLNKEAADARLETQRLKDEDDKLHRKLHIRILASVPFVETLRGKPTARAEFRFQRNDVEAYALAGQIRAWLGTRDDGGGVGWDVSEVLPMDPPDGNPNEPDVIRYGVDIPVGLYLGIRKLPPGVGKDMISNSPTTAVGALFKALDDGGLFAGQLLELPHLPEGTIMVLVGQNLH